jgi:hypothetical protein
MKTQILPTFKDIFPEEKQPTIQEIVATIPTDILIKVSSYINAQLYFSKERLKTEIKIFIHLIERITDHKLRNAPHNNLMAFKNRLAEQEIAIFPLPHTLKLIELAYLSDYIPNQGKTTPEQDLNILKALLIINSGANDKTIQIFDGVDMSNDESVYKIFWASLLPNSTILLRKDLILSLYKSLNFFKFLKNNYPTYLNQYLEVNQVDVYQKIPIKLFELYSNGYNKEQDFFYSYFNKDVISQNQIVANLSLDIKNFSRDEFIAKKMQMNFKGIRTFPVLKSEKEEYNISNWNFIIEKFYEGLVFDFYNKTNIKDLKELKSFEDYKGKMGDYFANIFFMNLMKEMFNHHPIICLKEKERNQHCDYDFYIRVKNNVFFFEFKDILFPINESYEDIKNTIDKKLVDNKKGIKQIIRQIKNFNQDSTVFDDLENEGISLKDINIYPVLVYTDNAFGMTGINHYLNNLFETEVSKELKNKEFSVKPLVLMSLDFLMEEYENFKSGKFDLVYIINLYYDLRKENIKIYEQTKTPITLQNAFEGFDVVIREKIVSNSKDLLNGYFYEKVIEDFKPFLQ